MTSEEELRHSADRLNEGEMSKLMPGTCEIPANRKACELKGGESLCAWCAYWHPDQSVYGLRLRWTWEPDLVSCAELIKALWPEGVEALKELSDIVQGMAEGESYQPDSFTGQPARLALASLEEK